MYSGSSDTKEFELRPVTETVLEIGMRVFGRHLAFRSDIEVSLDELMRLFPPSAVLCEPEGATEVFHLIASEEVEEKGFYWNGELLSRVQDHHLADLGIMDCKVQYALSLALADEYVMFHAGAVSYRGQGIIFPGQTKAGKTTLTEAFLLAGAGFLSDDCAVISKELKIYAYPTPLKVRVSEDDSERRLMIPANYGSGTISDPVDVKFMIFTAFQKGANWDPVTLGQGASAWKILPQLFYTPSIRERPAVTMDILGRLARNTVALEGERGDAEEVVSDIIGRIERRN